MLQIDLEWCSQTILNTHTDTNTSSNTNTNSTSSSVTGPDVPYTLPSVKRNSYLTNTHIDSKYTPYITVLITHTKSKSRTSSVSVAPILYRNVDGLPWKNE